MPTGADGQFSANDRLDVPKTQDGNLTSVRIKVLI
jgi:hypothetical protein